MTNLLPVSLNAARDVGARLAAMVIFGMEGKPIGLEMSLLS